MFQDATRFRIPLRSVHGECGFINIASWAPDTDKQLQPPPRSTTQVFEQQSKGHRRTQSLPPKLGVKLFVPFQGSIQRVFANPKVRKKCIGHCCAVKFKFKFFLCKSTFF